MLKSELPKERGGLVNFSIKKCGVLMIFNYYL